MEDWREGFYEAIREFLLRTQKYGFSDLKEGFVTGVTQFDPSPHYCDTCGPDPITVGIYYEMPNGETGMYTWYGNLGELISGL